jgi:alkanesulfonate monooxygenase SsuD/methylene tetrahydromethanopterin reductase-like flavin-dependent oxidoreductase (luciferase family)
MNIGVSLTSAYKTQEPRKGAQWMIERARAAREAGLDSLFVGDHHATPIPYYQNTPMLGRLLAEWGEAPAGCLFLLPLWNPVLAAEQVGTLAAIAQGRFIFQCGLGDDERQFAAMGADIKFRPSAFEESFTTIERLLRGETASSDGRFKFQNARVALLPAEPVESWIGAQANPAIDRAARLSDGWIASPSITVEEARVQAAIRRDIYVGESDLEAETTARSVIESGYRGFRSEALVIGGVQKTIETFHALGEAGYTDIIVRHITVEQSRVLDSTARLTEVRSGLLVV